MTPRGRRMGWEEEVGVVVEEEEVEA
jgi:hypothetical protein